MHQKIRLHTMTPTISAATDDQVHSTRIRVPCLVMPVGQPKRRSRSQSLAEQPLSISMVVASNSAEETLRVNRLRRTCPTASPW
jgi:hypothetical protein